MDLLKIFQRDPEDPRTELDPNDQKGDGLEAEYHEVIEEQLTRAGIAADCVTIEVKRMGRAADGRLVYGGMLRLQRWNNRSAIRMLLGLPLLQSKVRRLVKGSWLDDLSHFGGLWIHPSGQLEEVEAMEQLRLLVLRLEHQLNTLEGTEASQQSMWSVPLDLRGPESE